MKSDSSTKIYRVSHKITRLDGSIEWRFGCNVITLVGRQRMASHHAASNPGKTLITHLAFGTGDEAESEDNITLETELYRKVLANVFADGVTLYGHVVTLASDIGVGTYDITEAALFDAAVGGNMIARQVLDTTIEDFTGAETIDTLWGIINQ